MTSAKICAKICLLTTVLGGARRTVHQEFPCSDSPRPGTFTDSNGVKILQAPSGVVRGRVDEAEKEKAPVSDTPNPGRRRATRARHAIGRAAAAGLGGAVRGTWSEFANSG
jgi:hypothetical protein